MSCDRLVCGGPEREVSDEAALYFYTIGRRGVFERDNPDIMRNREKNRERLANTFRPLLKRMAAADILDSDSPEARSAFLRLLDDFLAKRGLSDEMCCRKANLNFQTLADLRRDPHCSLSYPTALALAFALELSVEESRALLGKAGYTLMRSNWLEAAAEFFLSKKIYDVHRVNRYLFLTEQCQLGMQYWF